MSNIFSTINIYLAAFLGLKGFSYELTRGHDGKLLFSFDNTPALKNTLEDFNNGGTVPAWQFVEYIKRFKTDLYNAKRG